MEEIVPTLLFFFLIIGLTYFVASIVFPLLKSANYIQPSWQLLKVANTYNFRQSLYATEIYVEVTSPNCRWSQQYPVWYFTPDYPGNLVKIEPDLSAIFQKTTAEPVGAYISTGVLYGVNYITLTFTDITNLKPGYIYGSPVTIETVSMAETTLTPQNGDSCTVEVKYNGGVIYRGSAAFVEIYVRTAVVK
ncbi:hypothetical protein TUZN_0929 [Thermoproteus uzoniensis 768-20]|uniref:Uncharacterized protein n=1 Tax=Thermoproteus uzoniensis (strain 768-20) TaxID=999630 RepID=F2L5W7_THEU7|nr:hypothetical protein [Thermoproteus uzoniensis]AEA12412.1 hypothetical protein TUZN_0929 [Thermoproteus uzoniensis 768-20]